MSSDAVIKVENLSKCYYIYDSPRDRLKQFVAPRLQRMVGQTPKRYFREFWALKDVSFEVRRGETVGIVGRNGSGKSTLLQMICGTINPSGGSVVTNGRIAALLELGSGFSPEFTGRDNVFMNASLLGLKRDEIESRFDSIVAFADIGPFLDQPVRTYSSGMAVRLAFAVQSQIDPDILVVDEALAVGDAKFQAKCFERLRQLKDGGTSILLVTHSCEQVVAHCTSAILLDQGSPLQIGEPKHVVNRYLDTLFGRSERRATDASSNQIERTVSGLRTGAYELSCLEDCFARRPAYNHHEYRWGDGGATILDFHLAADGDAYPVAVATGQVITVAVSVKFNREFCRPILGVTIRTKEGIAVYGVNSETLECHAFQETGRRESVVQAETTFVCRLAHGDYFISLGIATRSGEEVIPHDRRYDSVHLHVRPNTRFVGIADLELQMRVVKVIG